MSSPAAVGKFPFILRYSTVPSEVALLASDEFLIQSGCVMDMFSGKIHFVALQVFNID